MEKALVKGRDAVLGTHKRQAAMRTSSSTILEMSRAAGSCRSVECRSLLLAALRMWAQSHCRPDQVVREILETLDPVTLGEVAAELRAVGSPDARVACGIVTTMAAMPAGQLLAVAACALRAL